MNKILNYVVGITILVLLVVIVLSALPTSGIADFLRDSFAGTGEWRWFEDFSFIHLVAFLLLVGAGWLLYNKSKGGIWLALVLLVLAIIGISNAKLIGGTISRSVTKAIESTSTSEQSTGPRVDELRFSEGTYTISRYISSQRVRVVTPEGYCVGYNHADKLVVLEQTETHGLYQALVPVVVDFTKYHGSTARCRASG